MLFVVLALVVVSGAFVPVQAGVNAELGRHTGHPLLAGATNFCVGLTAIVVVSLLLHVPLPSGARLAAVPWWGWIGGLLGATLVVTAVVAAPRLGATLLIAALVTGQLASSVVIDHFGWLGYPARPVTLLRITGVVLLALGMGFVQRG
jgi:transporter family-2 protein